MSDATDKQQKPYGSHSVPAATGTATDPVLPSTREPVAPDSQEPDRVPGLSIRASVAQRQDFVASGQACDDPATEAQSPANIEARRSAGVIESDGYRSQEQSAQHFGIQQLQRDLAARKRAMPGASDLEVALAVRRDMALANIGRISNGDASNWDGTASQALRRLIEHLGG